MTFEDIDLNSWYYLLHPRPVAVLISGSWSNYSAMPASWVTPVSRRPPIVAVAIAKSRYTYHLLLNYKEFALCILSIDHVKSVNAMGHVSGKDVNDKIKYAGLSKEKAKRVSCPIIAESDAVLECYLRNKIEAGDHDLILGNVTSAYVRAGIDISKPNSYKPIMHVGKGRYTTTSHEYIEV